MRSTVTLLCVCCVCVVCAALDPSLIAGSFTSWPRQSGNTLEPTLKDLEDRAFFPRWQKRRPAPSGRGCIDTLQDSTGITQWGMSAADPGSRDTKSGFHR